MKIKTKNARKNPQQKSERLRVEDFVSRGTVDDVAVKGLEARAKKRMKDFAAEFTKSQEAPVLTTRMLCDEIRAQALQCLNALQLAREPAYKQYIEYFVRVEITGGIPHHATAVNLLESCFLKPQLPAEVLTFANIYAGYIHQAAHEFTLEEAKAYVDIAKQLYEKMPIDPDKNSTFIKIFNELQGSLKSVSQFPSVSFYTQCLTNVLLSIGLADPNTPTDKLIKLLSFLRLEGNMEKSVWYQTVGTMLKGLDRLNSQFKTLNEYSLYKIRQKIMQESIEPQAQVSNFMN